MPDPNKMDLGLGDDDQEKSAIPASMKELSEEERQFIKAKPSRTKKQKPVRVTVDLLPDVHLKLKILATKRGRPMTEELTEAIEAWLNRKGSTDLIN